MAGDRAGQGSDSDGGAALDAADRAAGLEVGGWETMPVAPGKQEATETQPQETVTVTEDLYNTLTVDCCSSVCGHSFLCTSLPFNYLKCNLFACEMLHQSCSWS